MVGNGWKQDVSMALRGLVPWTSNMSIDFTKASYGHHLKAVGHRIDVLRPTAGRTSDVGNTLRPLQSPQSFDSRTFREEPVNSK